MLSSALDIAGDIINHLVWMIYAIQGGDFLANMGWLSS